MNEQQFREKLEVLDGSRGQGARRKAAVRIEDIEQLLQVPASLKAAKVTAAPTKDDFNALIDDITAIHQRLRSIASALQGRLL